MPPRVKLFIAVLARPDVDKDYVCTLLSEVFGSTDYQGSSRPFDVTSYYEEEMGTNLSRYILAFRGPHYADVLVGAKLGCIELEKGSAIDGRRTINLDVGYLDHSKIVLASTKEAGQKLYLDANGNPWTVTDEIRTQDLVTTPQRRRAPGQQADTVPARRASLDNPAQ